MKQAKDQQGYKRFEHYNQINLTDGYRKHHPTTARYTLFSSLHETFSRIKHMLCHKTSLNKLKRTAIIQSMICDYSGIKLGINNRRTFVCEQKFTNMEIKHISK